MILAVVQGFVIGIANIIPGVSGGTLAFILGIYERLIAALRSVDGRFLAALIRSVRLRKEDRSRLGQEFRRVDAVFLGCIGAGAVAAILATSRLMEYLLKHHHEASYAFFLGLVVVSMIFPYRFLRRKSWKELVSFLVATALAAGLSLSVTDGQKIRRAEAKQRPASGEVRGVGVAGIAPETAHGARNAHGFVSFESPGAGALVKFFLAAGLAISAMILPGISGSFVLLVLGVYFDVLSAINERNLLVIGVFGLGLVGGMLVFARIMDLLLRRFHDATMSFMIGLMAGSLCELWPFKKIVLVGGEKLFLGNTVPEVWDSTAWAVAGSALAGAAIVLSFQLFEKRKPVSPHT